MELETTLVERAIHVVLFVAAGAGICVYALAGIERLFEGGSRIIRRTHLVVATAAVTALLAAERTYHAVR